MLNIHRTTLLLIGLSLLILNLLTWLYADDYTYGFLFCQQGGIDLSYPIQFSNLLESQYNHYFIKNGRTVVHLLDQFFLCFHDKHVFDVCNAIVTTGYIYMLQVVAHRKGWIPTVVIAFLTLVLWRSFGQVFLWQSGSLNYVWSGLCNLLLITVFVRRRTSDHWPTALLLLPVSVIVGWMHESLSVGIIALMAGLLLSDRRHQRGIHLAGAFMLVGYMVGTLLILCSPGTLIRAAASGTDLHYMLTHLPFGLLNIFMNLRLFWLLVIVMAVMHWRRHVAITGFLHDNRFLLLAIAAEALFLLPLGRVVEPRALFGMEMFSMILLLRLLPVTNIHLGRVAAVGYILLYLPVLNIVWQNHRDSQAFHEEMSRSDEAVFFDVPYYHGMSRHYVGSRIDLDHHRTAFNKEYAAYYGKQGILVLPSRYRQELYLTRSFLTPQHQCAPGVYTDDDITFDIIPLPDDQPLPPSTLDHEYVSFPSGKYLLRDNMPFVNDGNAQIRPQAKKRRRR